MFAGSSLSGVSDLGESKQRRHFGPEAVPFYLLRVVLLYLVVIILVLGN